MTVAMYVLAFALGYAIGCVRTNAVAVNAYEVAGQIVNDQRRAIRALEEAAADTRKREAELRRSLAEAARDAGFLANRLWDIGWSSRTTLTDPRNAARAAARTPVALRHLPDPKRGDHR
jgi:hypothetical protein